MTNDYFLQILMREREREILVEVRRCDYHVHRHRRGSGLSKKISGRLLSALKRFEAIAGLRQKRQQMADIMMEVSDPMLSSDRKSINSDMPSSWN